MFQTPTGESDKLVLTYFDFRGQAEPIRLMLEDAKVEYIDKRQFDWKAEKDKKDKFPFGQVPQITIGDFVLVQTDAIMRYLARELGYYGENSKECAQIDMIMSSVEDMRFHYLRTIYSGEFDFLKNEMLEKSMSWLSNLEYYLSKQNNGTHYITGAAITVADFSLFEQITVLTYIHPHILGMYVYSLFVKSYPLLTGFMERVLNRPHISEYIESERRPLRVNGIPIGTPKDCLEKYETSKII